MYEQACGEDILILFNSGGWGWNPVENADGWKTIVDGIKAEVKVRGYRALVLNYERTKRGLRGYIKEFAEEVGRYPRKAQELARKVEFLTKHLPELRVILAGESTGTVITDKAMSLLQDNPQVYSIQTGTPFWHKSVASARKLVMVNNGAVLDTFSHGKIWAIIWATIKGVFGNLSIGEKRGTVLLWLKAPGHDYSWQYPRIRLEITKFLQSHFHEKNKKPVTGEL